MPQEADFDHTAFEPQNQQAGDKALLVKFFLKSREDSRATLEKGRPMFKEVEYIDIKIPGNKGGGACRPASFADKQRFPEHYAAFKQRMEPPLDGTPLAEWTQISRSQVEALSFANVKTVEHLAEMADVNLSNFQGGNTLKRLANEWLKNSSEEATIAEKVVMQTEIEELKEQVKLLLSRIEKTNAEKTVTATAPPEIVTPEPEPEKVEAPEPEKVDAEKVEAPAKSRRRRQNK